MVDNLSDASDSELRILRDEKHRCANDSHKQEHSKKTTVYVFTYTDTEKVAGEECHLGFLYKLSRFEEKLEWELAESKNLLL